MAIRFGYQPLQEIAKKYGPVEISYNSKDEEMRWTVCMTRPVKEWDGEKYIDWYEHEHGKFLPETARALHEQLKRSRGF